MEWMLEIDNADELESYFGLAARNWQAVVSTAVKLKPH